RRGYETGVRLLITVDCGITAKKEIQEARDHGMDVIILDHHRLPSGGLPPANIILNPLQLDCPYPFKELSAAGLAFKLSQALLGDRAFELLDLAALSTVCDVAPLQDENRIIVKFGLEQMAKRKNPGLRALAGAAKLKGREINVGHLGFVFGPRINAAGRMSSPEIALQLLLTDQEREAESLAQVLEEENKARRAEEQKVLREAVKEVERAFNFNRDRVIVIGREGWHQGVIGIVAARLVDKFHRPAVVIAFEKGRGKGSGRSIKKFNLFEALSACSGYFEEFGGHAQAAGLVMKENHLKDFREEINDYARENCTAEMFKKEIMVDLEIRLDDLKASFIQELKLLEPHGAGNPRPVFRSRGLHFKGRPTYLSPQTIQIWVTDGSFVGEGILGNVDKMTIARLQASRTFDLTYSIKTKTWDGLERLSLEIKEIL
ncbi:MAG: DHH family phosphoesterase, partial [Candidatus Omnitrophica bacterium]|nr:DHH family phosphoesterase [Candidatus Omnitrophota bacterium]